MDLRIYEFMLLFLFRWSWQNISISMGIGKNKVVKGSILPLIFLLDVAWVGNIDPYNEVSSIKLDPRLALAVTSPYRPHLNRAHNHYIV